MISGDTIFAVSSGTGVSAISVVRLSGPKASIGLERLTGGLPEPRRASVRKICDPSSGRALDLGMVLWLPGPNSATGEDVAEFHIHGSRAVVGSILEVLGRLPGMRMAEAGEFTRRSFQNEKLDLVEIEGLADLLVAQTASQQQMALQHLMGEASSVYELWRGQLMRILARTEAAIDFADEDDVARESMTVLRDQVAGLRDEMAEALASANAAAAIREGVRVILAGLPNTGKSSLLNALARREAAIVSAIPGTTRDVIEVALDLNGVAVLLSDTAGLRAEPSDEIERIGMERTRSRLAEADVVVWVCAEDVDGSAVWPENVVPDIVVASKSDLGRQGMGAFRIEYRPERWIRVSAVSGEGLPELTKILSNLVDERYGRGEAAVVVRARQKLAVEESIRYLNDSTRHEPAQLELAAEDLRKAARTLARVTGAIEVDDLLDVIFSEFCIGK